MRTMTRWTAIAGLLAVVGLAYQARPMRAQDVSVGGSFLPNTNYTLGGTWHFRGANPISFEGATNDEFDTTLSIGDPTADRTFTLPDTTSGAFVLSSLTTNAIDVVNSIWGASNALVFEGATANGVRTSLSPTDVGADVTLTLPGMGDAAGALLGSSLTTNDLGAANSVWGASNGLTFEGATANAGELFLTVADIATASRTMTLPDMGAASAVIASTLTTNTVNVANSIWGISNALAFGGATGADGFEIQLTPADVGADRVVTIPDMAAASALLATTLTTNAPNVANSIWGISNAIAFGGATGADGFEIQLTPADVGADRVVTIPDMGAASALFASTLTTNAVGAANSIWGVSAGFVFEGSDADTEELTLTTADLTADITIEFRDDLVDTYYPLTMPDADITGGFWRFPDVGTADADLTMTDNTLYVYRVYLPHWITIANVYGRTTQGADVAGSDDILGVAIYEDADAGTQRTEALSADVTATADIIFDVTDVTLGPGFYRIGVCSGDGSGAVFTAETLDDEYIDVINAGAVTIGTGANACVAGDPPTTTGALTTADINHVVLKAGS